MAVSPESDIHSQIFHVYSERLEELKDCPPTGIIFVFRIAGAAGTDIDVTNINETFKNHVNFAVHIEENCTHDQLKTFIKEAATFKYPIGCNYIGFYFVGHGKIDEDSRPAFMVVPPLTKTTEKSEPSTCASLQKDILDLFISNKNEKNKKQNYMFFFDCCLSYPRNDADPKYYSSIKKPFAFDTPPQCIVSFATSPGLTSSGDPVNGGLWTSHFCEYLAKMDRGHTLTQVLEITNDAVMKCSEFEQPPRYHSCTGHIPLKGLYNTLLYSFKNYEEALLEILVEDRDVLVSLAAVLNSKNIIDSELKYEILQSENNIGARLFLRKVIQMCRYKCSHTQIVLLDMGREDKLREIIIKIRKGRKKFQDPSHDELTEKIRDYKQRIEDLKKENEEMKQKLTKIPQSVNVKIPVDGTSRSFTLVLGK